MIALLAENVEWHPVEEFPERQVLHGPAQVERHLRRLREAWEELSFEPIKLVEVPPHVIVAIHQRARGGASGIEVEGERAHAWTLKDDRAVRFESFRDFDEAVKATAALA